MYARLYFFIGITVFSGALLLSPHLAEAETQTDVFLDLETMRKGFTVENTDAHFRIGIPPNTFDEPAHAIIRNINEDSLGLPEGKVKVSNAYEYDIAVRDPHVLEVPLLLETTYFPYRMNAPRFYFFNNRSATWDPLPSRFIEDRSVIRARIPFPYSKVVVLEDIALTESDMGISLESKAALVMDAESGAILFEKNKSGSHPMASVTKLMTALVFLDHNPGWNAYYKITRQDQVGGSRIPFVEGERVRVRDLFKAMLIGSANNCAQAIARISAGNSRRFVKWMNEKANSLGMKHTQYKDVSGLSAENISTAEDMAILARAAFTQSEIQSTTVTKAYTFYTLASNYTVHTTDKLLFTDMPIAGGKTGYISASGYNLVLKVTHDSRDVIIVILGSPTLQASFSEATLLSQRFD